MENIAVIFFAFVPITSRIKAGTIAMKHGNLQGNYPSYYGKGINNADAGYWMTDAGRG